MNTGLDHQQEPLGNTGADENVKNTAKIESIQKNFGAHPVPELIKKILKFEQKLGIEHTRTSYLTGDEPFDLSEFYGDEASRLIEFAHCDSSQDDYCLWNQHNDISPDNWPVFVFGNEGGASCVAKNLEDFFIMGLKDLPMYGDTRNWPEDADYSGFCHGDEDDSEPSPLLEQYRDYLASLGLDVTKNPDEILRHAQESVNPAFWAWKQPLTLARNIANYRENTCERTLPLLITHHKSSDDSNLPSQFFPSAGTDTAWFEILGDKRPSWQALNTLLTRSCSDYFLMDYDEIGGKGYFVAVDSYAPASGILTLPIETI